MSESFPFNSAPEPESGSDRRKMALVAGLGALMVAVLGYFVVVPALAGDSGEAAPTTMVKKAPQKKATKVDAKAKAKKAAKKPAAQPAQYTDVSSRKNPFYELYRKPATTTTSSAPGGAPAAPAAPGTPPGTSGGTWNGTSGGSSTSVGGQRVGLMTVYTKDGVQYAQTRIGDIVYTPKVGQVFAVSYKLLAVSGKTATYLYGDEQFTLSVGQEVLK